MDKVNFTAGRNILKPLGSEKIQNLNERMARIVELSGDRRPANHTSDKLGINPIIMKEVAASNGDVYGILKERSKYFIRKKDGDKFTNLGGHALNERSYTSETKAMNQLNLMFAEINRLNEHRGQVDVYKKKI